MNGRQRILRILSRQAVDRPAFDLGGTDCSGIHVLAYGRLRQRLGLPEKPIRCGCLSQLVAVPDADFLDALGVEAEALWFGARETKLWQTPFGIDLVVPKNFAVEDLPDGSSVARNARGTIYARRAADAYYFDPAAPPLAPVKSAGELEPFDELFQRWDYSAIYDEPIEQLAARARQQYQSTDRAVVALWRMHYLQAGQILRGFEQFFVDLMSDRDLAHAFLGRLHRVYLERADTFLRAFGDSIDAVFLTDDLGTQRSGLISPALYREMLFPYISELVGRIKAAGKKVIMHSCGSVARFIPLLIEMGVDALNPVQVSAHGMNPRDLVREYGREIAFWGGGCDTQHAMNAGDPEVVRSDVRRRLEDFGPDAHLVFTQVHNIQYDVPPENVLALWDEFRRQAGVVGQADPKASAGCRPRQARVQGGEKP
jgi:uroporphyrinogen decarboxylase